jgi:hypothetical protein
MAAKPDLADWLSIVNAEVLRISKEISETQATCAMSYLTEAETIRKAERIADRFDKAKQELLDATSRARELIK